MKTCIKCGAEKSGRNCKTCKKAWDKTRYLVNSEAIKSKNKANRRTPRIWASIRWSDLNKRTVNGSNPRYSDPRCKSYLDRGIRLEMSKTEFYDWVAQHWSEALAIWAAGEIPSIDRINSDGHYSLDNIRFLSFKENSALGSALGSARGGKATAAKIKAIGGGVDVQEAAAG